MSSNDDDDLIELEGPTLEEPTTIESPEAGVGTLFSDDLPSLASKVVALESLLKLLTSNIKFQEFCREVLLILTRTIKSEAGSLLEINHDDRTIFFRAAVGHTSDRVVRFVIPFGKGIVGHVAESRQPLLVSNASENEQHLRSIADAVGFEVRNLIAMPIVIRGKVFAVLELLNRIGDDNYSEADIELLQAVCEMVSKALEVRLMLGNASKSHEDAA